MQMTSDIRMRKQNNIKGKYLFGREREEQKEKYKTHDEFSGEIFISAILVLERNYSSNDKLKNSVWYKEYVDCDFSLDFHD